MPTIMRIQQMHAAAWYRQQENDPPDEPEAVKVPAPKKKAPAKKAAKKKKSKR